MHPHHALFTQARDRVVDAHERLGLAVPDPEQLDRIAAQVTIQTRALGHTTVGKVGLGLPEGAATQVPDYLLYAGPGPRCVMAIDAPQAAQAPDLVQASQQLQVVEQTRIASDAAWAQQKAMLAQQQGRGMTPTR